MYNHLIMCRKSTGDTEVQIKVCDDSNRDSGIMIVCPGWFQHLSRTQPDYTKTGHSQGAVTYGL